jgi:hypothetical protein
MNLEIEAYEGELRELRKAAERYIRPGTVIRVDVETTAILVDLLRQSLAKPEWVGLTESEIDGLIASATYMDETSLLDVVNLVGAKLKEKNT